MTEDSARKGFTKTKAVRSILRPYEKARVGRSRRVPFEGLPAPATATLLTKLPPFQQDVASSPDAPTFAALVEAGLKVTGAVFDGYRADPDEPDGERVALTRIAVPADTRTKEALDTLVSALPEHQHRLQVGNDGSAYITWEPARDN